MDRDERKAELLKMRDRPEMRGSRIFLVLPEAYGLVRQLEFPLEVRDRLRSVVEFQVESLSPWPVEDIYWDMGWSDPGKGAKSLAVSIAIIAREVLDPWIDLFESANLPLSGVNFSTLSSGHAARVLWTDATPTLLLNLEPEYAEGAVIQRDRINSISVSEPTPVAGRAGYIVGRLSSLGRMSEQADTRTLAYGSLRDDLGRDNPALPIDGATPAGRVFGSIAAALTGLGESPFAANLVPEDRRFRSNVGQLVPTAALLVLVAVVATGLALRGPYQWSVYASELEAAIRTIAPSVRDLTEQEAELNALTEKYRALDAHLSGLDRTLETLQELVRVLPPDTWLNSFALQESNVTISGFAASASELQRLIEENLLFENAEFSSSVTRDEVGRDRFTLRVNLVEGES